MLGEYTMKSLLSLLAISFFSFSSFAQGANEVLSFSDGSKVNCVASSNIGNDGKGYSQRNMEVYYRIDRGQSEAQAYFRNVIQIGNYSYDGSCSKELCELSIRDLRTNTVSILNASYAKMNKNTAQIEIMNFNENITLTLACSLLQQ
jgi:hypothetical protein